MGEEVEEIYQSLIDAGFTEEEIDKEITIRFNEFQGFLSKPAILFLIAKEKGIILPNYPQEYEHDIDYNDFLIPIAEITEEMTNLVITGKISEISEVKTFIRKDGSSDIVSSFYLIDNSGRIKVVLWSDHAKIMEHDYFKKGEIIQVIGGYTKKGYHEELEVHLSKKGKIVFSPENNEVPTLKKAHSKSVEVSQLPIKKLYTKKGFITTITGTVCIDSFKELTLKNGEYLFLLKFKLSDETSSILVNIWGMRAVECLKTLNNGEIIRLDNVIIKMNPYINKKEIFFTKITRVTLLK